VEVKESGIQTIDIIPDADNLFFSWAKVEMDFYYKYLKKRILLVNEDISNDLVEFVTMRLLDLDEASDEPIVIFINSAGGNLYEGINMFDVLKSLRSPVATVTLGHSLSSAFVAMMGGDYRVAYPHSALMMHSISTTLSAEEKTSSILKEGKYLAEITKQLSKEFSLRTEKSVNFWKEIMLAAHDTYFFADTALKYGIIHEIVKPGVPLLKHLYDEISPLKGTKAEKKETIREEKQGGEKQE